MRQGSSLINDLFENQTSIFTHFKIFQARREVQGEDSRKLMLNYKFLADEVKDDYHCNIPEDAQQKRIFEVKKKLPSIKSVSSKLETCL